MEEPAKKVERCSGCGAIKCPSCLAPLKSDGKSCPYCGVELVFSQDGQFFAKVEQLSCQFCGAKISRHSPFCPSCNRKTWQYCGDLSCEGKFSLDTQTCPVCSKEVRRSLERLEDDYQRLRETLPAKVQEEIQKELDPLERVFVQVAAVEDVLILTDSRLIQRSGNKYFSYPFGMIEDASLDKYGNLTIALGGEKPHDLIIICPEKKTSEFSELIELLLKFRKKSKIEE